MTTESLRETLNRANPNTMADILRALKIGDVLMSTRRKMYAVTPDATTRVVLPSNAKAERVLSVWARAGTGTKGPLALSATPLAPGAGEFGLHPNGDVALANADAWTSIDIEYEPIVGTEEVVLEGYPVVTNVLTLPTRAVPAVLLVEVTGYTALGVAVPCTIMAPGTATSAGEAEFALPKATITFAAADGVVTADVTLRKAITSDIQALLLADSQVL